ncbi:methyltransferase domain-containing protein [Nocardia panacis]|uniref:Methyltransferase domain-containing protein n=1 Tax=Nocardia panacis TaxID=2340916 RepID=A0A3A4KK41_9NOCA|nr:methyltransferase domain-containing protein [Nocardia panacis]RJO77034.1 methyltransferase domain-containing protein [Nocardia panacis]
MSIRTRVLSVIAGQLGNPHGLLGKGVAPALNRGNAKAMAACVEATGVGSGDTAADLGFGGGAGLSLLLDRVGPAGAVHGVELSSDMLARATTRFAPALTAGRLHLASGSLTALPLDTDLLDAAITVNTIYFVPDLPAACAELARVVRPGGRVVLGIGDPAAMAKLPFTQYGFALRPVAEVIAALEEAGCTVTHREIPNRPFAHHVLTATPR